MFRKILSVITLALVAYVIWEAREQIFEAFNYLSSTNLLFIFLLIPEQLFMYYCAGQMFFSYMSARKDAKKISKWILTRIAFELNFVNHAIPSGGVSGLGYITWRLKEFGATTGQVSFMYILRYVITISANQLQTLIAILFLLMAGNLSMGSLWMIGLTILTCLGVIFGVAAVIVVAGERKRIDWASSHFTKFVNFVVRKLTFGRKKQILKREHVHKYLMDLHDDLMTAKRNKRMLKKPIIWGIIYSLLEVSTYWFVSISMGHPETLPQIMVAEAIGSFVGAVIMTPGGVGGYEGSMIFVMSTLGIDIGLATAVVVTTRVIVMLGTVISGYGFYQHAISKIGKSKLKDA